MGKFVRSGFAAAALLMTSLAAQGADMPVPIPAPVAAWAATGIYIGGHIGAGWSTEGWDDTDDDRFGRSFAPLLAAQQLLGNNSANGVLGGGQVGLNYQTGVLVWGIEGNLSAMNFKGGRFSCVFEIP